MSVAVANLPRMASMRIDSPTTRSGKRATKSPGYSCTECGWQAVKWVGRCGECQQWGTLVEASITAETAHLSAAVVATPAVPIAEVDATAADAHPTGNAEVDRVLGGGLVPGAVILLAGEPGIGKSTLLLSTLASSAHRGARVLYVTGEESAAQVRLRAERINALHEQLFIAAEHDLAAVLTHIENVRPDVLVIDSVQTMSHPLVEGAMGGVNQVREVASTLARVAKANNLACLLVGHVTKDGAIAGPRALEHLVDVVLQIEGDRFSRLRLLRAVKNRYGAADELGCFELGDDGVWSVADPSGLFISRHDVPVAGSCLTVVIEGRRPIVAEVQALVAATSNPVPRRATQGIEGARAAMMLAVLERRAGVRLADRDVYLATVGGVRIHEPAADLAAVLAIASAASGKPVTDGTAAIGEVGLAGEIRNVVGLQRRLAEVQRLGLRRVLVPAGAAVMVDGVEVLEVADVTAALALIHA